MGLPIGVQILGRSPARLTVGAARLFDAAGADSLWVIDHWMGLVPLDIWDRERFSAARLIRNPEESFDPFAFLGALAARTRRARLGTAVTEAVRRHPVQLAQAALTLHHLSGGRFILGVGAGERENIEPYGLSFAGQASRMEEALYLIRLLWRSEGYVSHEGRFFQLDGAVMGLGPHRGTFPPIWVAAHGPRTLRIAGRYGDGWLPTHHMEPDEYADHLGRIRVAAEDAGRRFDRFVGSYELRVLPAPSHREAHRLLDSPALRLGALIIPPPVWARVGAEHPFGRDYRGIVDWIPSRLDPREVLRLMDEVPFEVIHAYVDHGTWRELASRILSYRAVGLRHAVLANVAPLVDPRTAPASFRSLIRLIRALR
ncbi:MAG: LLM class flavin-dependent oxidoreductase [Actinomycetota bacterium]